MPKADVLNIHHLLFDFISNHRFLFLGYLICTLVLYPINFIGIPKFYGNVINSFKDNKQSLFLYYLQMLFAGYVVAWLFESMVLWLQYHLVPNFSEYATSTIFEFILDNYEIDFENIHTGEILSKIIRMPGILFEYVDVFRTQILKDVFVLVSAIYTYWQVSPLVALVYTFFVVVNFTYVAVMYKIFYKFNRNTNKLQDKMYEYLIDCFNNLSSVYAFNQKQSEVDRFHNFSFKKYKNIMSDNLLVFIYGDMFWGLITVAMFICMNFFIYRAYLNQTIKAEQLISTFVITFSILRLYETAEGSAQRLSQVFSQIGDTEGFFNEISNVNRNTNKTDSRDFVYVDIVFSNIYHKYKDEFVLENINLTIRKGEKVALVGQIGSGKSTLIKLLLAFQPIQMGTVTIGGVDVNDIPNQSLRNNIFYIPQKPKLFNRTLYDNVVYGLGDNKPSKENILRLLGDLDLHDIAKVFEQKMDDEVGVDGNSLSGGQKQVVWLLRSFYRQSKILILDEPTAALDPEHKMHMVKIIKKLSPGKTVIIISHDDIDPMFRKVELKQGRMVHSGFFG
jgi:ABC-type multidrug transport system fused ATPase/permease subunit